MSPSATLFFFIYCNGKMSNNSAPQKPHVNGLVFKTDIKVFPGFNFAIKGPWSKGDDEYSKKKLEGEKIVIFFLQSLYI